MWKEFRAFISRGNVMDLAVAVVIGTAFTAIVTSLVDDIIMPLIGVVLGGVDFTSLSVSVGDAVIAYGNFIQAIINFLIIAVSMFFVVKGANSMVKKQEAAPAPPPAPTAEEKLLTQIRDILQEQAGTGR
ncbi:MAG: large-conductance mechanosensitive channel protein MscL [Caldilinea sp.]|nr:large-conductance mechanosensitive channel protein MscL [Caldilinea sp.]